VTVFAGPLGGHPAELFECPGSFLLPFSLDADLLAFDETRCVPGSSDVVVRSLADGSVRRVPMSGRRIEALALAGERLRRDGPAGPVPGHTLAARPGRGGAAHRRDRQLQLRRLRR
jgi:hypothetical protein